MPWLQPTTALGCSLLLPAALQLLAVHEGFTVAELTLPARCACHGGDLGEVGRHWLTPQTEGCRGSCGVSRLGWGPRTSLWQPHLSSLGSLQQEPFPAGSP